ncbi:MAG: SDR family oxidoreductase [Thermoplasmataceae archaeon]
MLRVIVAGVGPGMGCSIAKILRSRSYDVSIISRSEFGEKLAGELGAHYKRCDLTNFAEVRECIGELAGKMGGVDALVHCAGGFYSKEKLEQVTSDFLHKAIQNNVETLFNTVQAVFPFMKKNGGSIVAITAAKNVYLNGNVAYAAAKGSVAYLVRKLAAELAPNNIRVNSIAPGFISKDDCGTLPADRILLRKDRYPSISIAMAVDHLLSNPIITGQDIEVDGGVSTQVGI